VSQILSLESTRVTATDGVELAVYAEGPRQAPTVVLVHGYPDNHRVWDGVAAELVTRFRVVRYDVRGAGESGVPPRRSAYRLPQLAADLGTVLDAVSPHDPVHLVAHDWGSIQAWEAVTDPAFAERLLTFTSISGPSLDMAGRWMRGLRRQPRAVLGQLLHSYYIGLFQVPVLPELAARRGLVRSLVARSAAIGRPEGRPRADVVTADAVHGIELYRANFAPRMARPRPRPTRVPVLVLAPEDDPHVSTRLQFEAPVGYASDLQTQALAGNHWVIEHDPALVAGEIRAFIDAR